MEQMSCSEVAAIFSVNTRDLNKPTKKKVDGVSRFVCVVHWQAEVEVEREQALQSKIWAPDGKILHTVPEETKAPSFPV